MKIGIVASIMIFSMLSCRNAEEPSEQRIIFLHHSTGELIWNGNTPSLFSRAVRKISGSLADRISGKPQIVKMMEKFNEENSKNYVINEIRFPKTEPYGWMNYPYDYFNIWVRNAGGQPYMEEPTLEILTRDYNVIVFKHCFPVSNIKEDEDSSDINSDRKTISNYKLQYYALRDKLNSFPDTKFILFTGAAQVKNNISEEEALRARNFFTWVVEEWDMPGDNIYIWDLYKLQTEGGLYFKDEYAVSPDDSHPNMTFSLRAGKLMFNRIIDVINKGGEGTTLTGEHKYKRLSLSLLLYEY